MWFVATFGNDGHLRRWPTEIIKEQYRKVVEVNPHLVVHEAVVEGSSGAMTAATGSGLS
jgi:hypothetical protein